MKSTREIKFQKPILGNKSQSYYKSKLSYKRYVKDEHKKTYLIKEKNKTIDEWFLTKNCQISYAQALVGTGAQSKAYTFRLAKTLSFAIRYKQLI